MIRFVLDPESRVVPDLKRSLPGRGVWVTAEKEKVLLAVKRNLFARGFKQPVKADAGLVDMIEERLMASLSGMVSMARKAGGGCHRSGEGRRPGTQRQDFRPDSGG